MYATPNDVQTLLARPLDAPEQTLATVLLATVLRRITRRVTNLDTIDPDAITSVQANAVARVLKNPDGYRSEGAGEFSYSIDTRAAAGFLIILDDEWTELGVSTVGWAAPVTDGYISPKNGLHPFLIATMQPLWW